MIAGEGTESVSAHLYRSRYDVSTIPPALHFAVQKSWNLPLHPPLCHHPFHDTILNLGSVPLPVLEQEVRAFIAGEKAK